MYTFSMNTLVHANIFFYISSLGFILIFVIFAVIGLYIVSITRTVHRIVKRIERDIATVGDTAKEFVVDLQESPLFSLFFRKKKKYTKKDL